MNYRQKLFYCIKYIHKRHNIKFSTLENETADEHGYKMLAVAGWASQTQLLFVASDLAHDQQWGFEEKSGEGRLLRHLREGKAALACVTAKSVYDQLGVSDWVHESNLNKNSLHKHKTKIVWKVCDIWDVRALISSLKWHGRKKKPLLAIAVSHSHQLLCCQGVI